MKYDLKININKIDSFIMKTKSSQLKNRPGQILFC